MALRKTGIIRGILFLLFTVCGIALVRDTWENGHDFAVFWRGAHSVLSGESLYLLSRDGGMVFKYPPWILPFFLPFGLISLSLAKFCWGLIEVLSLVAVVQWLRIYGRCREATWVGVLVSFWGLWAVHALDGQVALVVLAFALWAWVPQALERSWGRSLILVFALSTKIFTLFPLLSFLPPYSKGQGRASRKGVVRGLGVVGILLLFSVPALMAEPSGNPILFFRSWMDSATSGGALLTVEQIRGRYNPSLTSLILRLLRVPPDQSWADVGLACFLAGLLGWVWKFVSRSLAPSEAWIGWLALAPVIHPLPWWHLFVFAFPLAVVSLDRGAEEWRRNGSLGAVGFAVLGVALICVSTEKVLGSLGLFLEMACAKSWGVLLCGGVLAHVASQTAKVPKWPSYS